MITTIICSEYNHYIPNYKCIFYIKIIHCLDLDKITIFCETERINYSIFLRVLNPSLRLISNGKVLCIHIIMCC